MEQEKQLEAATELRVIKSRGRQLGWFQLPNQGQQCQCQAGHHHLEQGLELGEIRDGLVVMT